MTTPSGQPSDERSIPGNPSDTIWDAESFQMPKYLFFPFPWPSDGALLGLALLGGAGVFAVLYACFA